LWLEQVFLSEVDGILQNHHMQKMAGTLADFSHTPNKLNVGSVVEI
jgi:hypothetical protein